MSKKALVDVKNSDRMIGNPENPELFKIYTNTIGKYKPLSREEEGKLFRTLFKLREKEKTYLDKISVLKGKIIEYTLQDKTSKVKESETKITKIETDLNDSGILASISEIKEKLCKHNLLFVLSVAKIYARNTTKSIVRLEDLVSEGNIGLYHAIDKFDYKTGNKFISYAVWHIRQQILKSIGDHIKNIRTPQNRQTLNKWVNKKQSELEQILSRPVELSELFDIAIDEGRINIDTRIETFVHTIESAKFETSLSSPLKEDNDFTLGDTIQSQEKSPHDKTANKELVKYVHQMLNHERILPWVKEHLMDYFGIDGRPQLTFRQIGEKHDVTQETIRQRIEKALRFLRYRNKDSRKYFLSISE